MKTKRYAKYLLRGLAWSMPTVTEKGLFAFENCLMRGRDIRKPLSDEASVLFFTTHKCASTLMRKILVFLADHHLRLRTADMDGYVSLTTSDNVYGLLEQSPHVFRKTGVLYGPLRNYVHVPDLGSYRVILMIRDPRDVLVSRYFSDAYSHLPPLNRQRLEAFKENRSRVQALSVEEFVFAAIDEWAQRYRTYEKYLLGQRNVTLLRYEDMILETEKWLSELAGAFHLVLSDKDKEKIYRMGMFHRYNDEDKHAHVRKAIPGDHREKLSLQAQKSLNSGLADVLDAFGYRL